MSCCSFSELDMNLLRLYRALPLLCAMEPAAKLSEGMECVERIDDDIYRVYDTDDSVHTVRRRSQHRRGDPQAHLNI